MQESGLISAVVNNSLCAVGVAHGASVSGIRMLGGKVTNETVFHLQDACQLDLQLLLGVRGQWKSPWNLTRVRILNKAHLIIHCL